MSRNTKGQLSTPMIAIISVVIFLIVVSLGLLVFSNASKEYEGGALGYIKQVFSGLGNFGITSSGGRAVISGCDGNQNIEACKQLNELKDNEIAEMTSFIGQVLKNGVSNEDKSASQKTEGFEVDSSSLSTQSIELQEKVISTWLGVGDIIIAKIPIFEADIYQKYDHLESFNMEIRNNIIYIEVKAKNGPWLKKEYPIPKDINLQLSNFADKNILSALGPAILDFFTSDLKEDIKFNERVTLSVSTGGFPVGPGNHKYSVVPQLVGNKQPGPSIEVIAYRDPFAIKINDFDVKVNLMIKAEPA